MNQILDMPKVGIKGIIASWEVVNRDGSIARACYKPKSNLILNCGLDLMGKSVSLLTCIGFLAVGSGTSTPSETQTYLDSETTYGGSGTRPMASVSPTYPAYDDEIYPTPEVGADPYIVIYQLGVQTGVGVLNGNFTEIGFSPYNRDKQVVTSTLIVGQKYWISDYKAGDDFTNVGGENVTDNVFVATGATPAVWTHYSIVYTMYDLFSRFRICDEYGTPTSVAVSADQQLRLKYQLAIRFLPIVSTHYTTNMVGISATFGYDAGWQSICETSGIDLLYSLFGTSPTTIPIRPATYSSMSFSDISVTKSPAVVLPSPSFAATLTVANTRDTYVDGSYANYINVTISVLEAVGTIYGLAFPTTSFGSYIGWLCIFDTPIVKPDTHKLTFKIKFTWGRDT